LTDSACFRHRVSPSASRRAHLHFVPFFPHLYIYYQRAALDGLESEEHKILLGQEILEAARRYAERSKGLAPDVRRRRLIGYLQRRGHAWGTVSGVLKALGM
jgi:hypothetical protein